MTQEPLQPKLGEGYVRLRYKGKPFVYCVIELLKNSFDWGASRVLLSLDEGAGTFRIVDDGRGMDRANRDAFVSLSATTANRATQSGRYCTGTKAMLFSHASEVRVVTAPTAEPDSVFAFEFATDEYEGILSGASQVIAQRSRRSPAAWPHRCATGTDIVYALRDPQSRSVPTAQALAEMLAARLTARMAKAVTVNGNPLPPRKTKGATFERSLDDDYIDKVRIELYRPEKPTKEHDLRFTGADIGEISVRKFHGSLGHLAHLLPPVLLASEVCGTISAAYLKQFANEDRHTFDVGIVDHPDTQRFLNILQDLAPKIQETLHIRVEKGDSAGTESLAESIMSLCNRRYGTASAALPGGSAKPGTGGGQPRPAPELRIETDRDEYEPGERADVTAVFHDDPGMRFSAGDLQWSVDGRQLTPAVKTARGCVVDVGKKIGIRRIRASVPEGKITAETTIRIVQERRMHLSRENSRVRVGVEHRLAVMNADKSSGRFEWSLDDPGRIGELTKCGEHASFRAHRKGVATAVVRDAADHSIESRCVIIAEHPPKRLLRIREHSFTLQMNEAYGERVHAVCMSPGGDDGVHELNISTNAPGIRAGKNVGAQAACLMLMIAYEYVRFVRTELSDEDETDDQGSFCASLADDAGAVFGEVLSMHGK